MKKKTLIGLVGHISQTGAAKSGGAAASVESSSLDASSASTSQRRKRATPTTQQTERSNGNESNAICGANVVNRLGMG